MCSRTVKKLRFDHKPDVPTMLVMVMDGMEEVRMMLVEGISVGAERRLVSATPRMKSSGRQIVRSMRGDVGPAVPNDLPHMPAPVAAQAAVVASPFGIETRSHVSRRSAQ